MSKKTKKCPQLVLKLRYAKDRSFCTIWLLARDGASDANLLHGECPVAVAEHLAERLGLEIEREEWLFEQMAPIPAPGCAELPAQQSLFEDGE